MDARLHQGLVVLAGALLAASYLATAAAVADVAHLPDPLVWLARLVSGAVAWLVLCPVLVGVPRMLGLGEAPDVSRWASATLWGAAVLGAALAVVEVVGAALGFVSSVEVDAGDRLTMVGTALVAAAVAGLAFAALTTRRPDA